MLYMIAFGSAMSAWALLRLLGGEREKRLQVLRATIDSEVAAAQAAAEAAREHAARRMP